MKKLTSKKRLIFTLFLLILSAGFQAASLYAQCGACGGTPQTVNWAGWSFQFVRPCLTQSTTAGGRGGGIEIQFANYNGRRVFFKAHTPILNVKYQNDACGPYRDWQYQESRFQCNGVVAAPGRCNGTATTNCANPAGGDVGGFCGVSVDTSDPNQVVLTTVLQAGWYRYQLEWTFVSDGTFRPAIKWTAVPAGCLNFAHIHFVYWRIDYDIESSSPNTIEEWNDVPLVPGYFNTGWDPLFVEMTRMKDTNAGRWWRIRNNNTNRAYIIQSPESFGDLVNIDGVAPVLQIDDIWALRYNAPLQEETDDAGSFSRWWIQIGKFIDYTAPNDNMRGQDVVFWYGAAHSHAGTGVPPPCDEVQGPYSYPDPAGPAW